MAGDGTPRVFLNSLFGRVEEGFLVRVWGSQRDITERNAIEDALRSSETHLARITTMVPGAVFEFRQDPDGRMIFPYLRGQLMDRLGVTDQTRLEDPMLPWSRVLPEDLSGVMQSVQAAVAARSPWNHEFRAAAPDGSIRWIRGSSLPETTASDGGIGFFGLLTDVTEQREAEEQSRQFFELSPDLLFIAGRDGRFQRVNASCVRMLGYTEEELISTPVFDLVHPEDRVHGLRAMKDLGLGQRLLDFEVRAQRKDGHWIWVSMNVILASARGPIYALGRDVTERKAQAELLARQALDLARARDAALEASRVKSQFLANMSHEIRTPLNAIFGMTELVLDSPLGTRQRKDIETVRTAAGELLQLVDNVFDVSRLEARKLELQIAPFSFREAVAEVLQPLAPRARAKGVGLRSEIAEDIPDRVQGDDARVRQILSNVVGNAVKFTDQGEVAVRVRREDSEGSAQRLIIEVSDTGVGIPPERQEGIFEPFVQADGLMTRRFSGTGLGLTISARLAELMGGWIEVQSQAGRGSTFRIVLALGGEDGEASSARPREGAEPAPEPPPPLHVLLAEDDEFSMRVTIRMLEKLGYRVTNVMNGREAYEALQRESPSLVVMDLEMPEMDGVEATRLIRERERVLGGHVPIIALTGGAREGAADLCMRAGMDAFATKPVNLRMLRQAIEEAMVRA